MIANNVNGDHIEIAIATQQACVYLRGFIGRDNKRGEQVQHKVNEENQEEVEENPAVDISHFIVIRI